ncbi:XrtN system VIT domain-containing protein [Flavobacterium sp. SM2513]|uniref:XrtN system VIT domain-containing protein n=1 Tax=Flavobacterium sp. SM2513 TaxID=3424766 RepID=UPI003D7F67CA
MGVSLESLKKSTSQVGVKLSIGVTAFSILMLIIALLGIEFKNEVAESLCFFALIVQLFYGVILCFLILKKREKYNHLIPFLFLNWFIGCFCTNVLVNIFENLPIWVYASTFIFCITNFFIYSNFRQKIITPVSYFFNGLSFVLIIYYAIYLIPIAPYSAIGILALGLGFYGLVPMVVLIIHSATLVKVLSDNKRNTYIFFSGIATVFFGVIFFTIMLNAERNKIQTYSVTKSFENNADLPTYITISQNLEPNFFNEILLKRDIVYVSTENFFEFRSFNNFGQKQYNERKIHNPFINIGYVFTNDLNLSTDDRINILKSNFDKRLETEEQLWSGRDLITKNIKEDVKIYTKERLAYTEITMDIACDKKSWGQKEAIYSFQLPEGSVATSLSLWVNGIERKGILTTKEKAEKAYKQIVGVEARDPSLMQWKEGNRVVVRVFPISKDLPRTFKCGFTTPLKVEGETMKYESLNIKGPNISNAETVSRIQMVGDDKFEASKVFELKNGYYINESKGLDEWDVNMDLSNQFYGTSFVWKDNVYEIEPIEKEMVSFTPSEIVLDLNANWDLEEIKEIVKHNDRNYFVWQNQQKKEINSSNYEAVFEEFESLHYSLLPLFKLKDNSLVITKSGEFSANFEELQTSNYLSKLRKRTKNRNLKVINISNEINPFWQTVKEQKYVDYLKTDLENTLKLIQNNQFVSFPTAENSVIIESSNCVIREKSKTSAASNGSNHIFRMYAFGKVLEEQVAIQDDSLLQNKYVDLAKEANIVTPISSLIVLETDADYETHGIEKNVNTLGNASMNNDGAVPEPHEWLLITVGLGVIAFYYKKSKKQIA